MKIVNLYKELEQLKKDNECPEWLTLEGYTTLKGGYLLEDETPKAMYRRVARAAAKSGKYSDDIKDDFFEIMYESFLGAASPILMNLGTERGLPISCFGINLEDRMEDIMGRGPGELAMMSKNSGGVGIGMDNLRPSGSVIKSGKNGTSDGVIPFIKVYDSATLASKQGRVRRGNSSANLNIEHKDWEEFVRMRRPEGDVNRQALNMHHCTMINDEFMHKVKNGDSEARLKWTELLKTRLETGEPYVMFNDTVNNNNPQAYKNNGLKVNMTNICSEITLFADEFHSFICCLSSLNLEKYDEWKDYKSPRTGYSVPEIATIFLNGVLDEFINKAANIPYMERTVSSAKNGTSDGVIPFIKVYDSATLASKQGRVRRGNSSANLNIEHKDWEEFVRMRRPEGDVNRQALNMHHCTMINDEFMHKVKNGDSEARLKWTELLKTRLETGEPYVMFNDTVNNNNPQAYKNNGLKVNMTNICSEITLFADEFHSFICCLSSLNLEKYDEWKDYKSPRTGYSVPEIATIFLNGVLDEFINKAANIPYMERTVSSAKKGRAIGIGVMGWHSYLQRNNIAFESFRAMQLNNEIHKYIKEESVKASKNLAEERGEPEWCKSTGMYNSHLLALAPTRSNSIICGDVSASIEPIVSNAYNDITAKGTFQRRNLKLKKVLSKLGKDTDEVWKSIVKNSGSVQHLEFLTEDQKNVYKTAYELDQNSIIQQASQRQKYICQSQSLNLFFPFDVDPRYFNKVHIKAWELGVKTLYYCRSTSGIKSDNINSDEGCNSCEG